MLHREEYAAQVDIEDPVPFLLTDCRRRLDLIFDPGIVECEIEPPECFDGFVQCGLDFFRLRDVTADGERPPAELLDHPRRFLIAAFRDVSDRDARSLAGERNGGGTADSVRRTSYE